MTPLFVPGTPATELLPSTDGSAAALQALGLADVIRAAGAAAFGAHELAVRSAR